ncbi:hypothetical protein [Streptomonospora alba]|uniref:hypothetical protein n=1 Tax=Streptomonospora alba TaxID=183763 RepID=UPI0012ED61D0|nr:hypothetical protein [Streptomonospora alba]
MITRNGSDVRWWAWAGTSANLTLRATLVGLAEPGHQVHDSYLRLREDVDPAAWATARDGAADRTALPEVSEKALEGLKFSSPQPCRRTWPPAPSPPAWPTGREPVTCWPRRRDSSRSRPPPLRGPRLARGFHRDPLSDPVKSPRQITSSAPAATRAVGAHVLGGASEPGEDQIAQHAGDVHHHLHPPRRPRALIAAAHQGTGPAAAK